MKKTIATMTAAILLLTPLSACGLIKEKTGATLEVSLENCYIAEQIDYGSKTLNPECNTDTGVLLTYTDNGKNRQQHAIFWDMATETFTEKELHSAGKKHGNGRLFPLADGRIGMVFQNTSTAVRDWEYDDYDAYIDIYSSDMTYEETIPFSLDTNGTYVYNFSYTESGGTPYYVYVYQPNGYVWDDDSEEDYAEIMVLDGDLQYVDAIHVPSSLATIFQGASGDVYVSLPLNKMDNTYTYSRIDFANMQLQPVTLETDSRYGGRDILRGTNGYEFYTVGTYGLCGVTFDGTVGESKLLIDFPNSNFLPDNYLTIAPTPDGRFIIRDQSEKSQNLWLVRERTEEEIKSMQVISMAGVDLDAQLQEVVNRFNRTHSDYRIMMVDYMQFVTDAEEDDYESEWLRTLNETMVAESPETAKAANLFMQDLLNGIAPDIICTDHLPYVQLANKGLFLDMTELMKKDDRFREEDYVMSFFDAMKIKGEQQTIAFSFYINTIAGKTEEIGSAMGLSADAYADLLNNTPENMKPLSSYNQETYTQVFLPWLQSSFLDTENQTCHFDTPAFAQLLEIGGTMDKYREWSGEIDDREVRMLLKSWTQPIDYRRMYVMDFKYADMTLVGYPSLDGGNGGIFSAPYTVGINAMSNYQDVVWDIFMELLGEDTQRYLDVKRETYSFPVLRSALEEDLDASAKGAQRMEGNQTIGKNSEEDVAFLKDYINNMTMFYYSDPTIANIIVEEAEMYYAGDQTAEEAAKMIQSRASIYISEQY